MFRLRSMLPALGLLLAVAIAACDDGATAPAGVQTFESPTLFRDGLEWTGTVDVMESFPLQLVGRIEIANPGSESIELVFANGCDALLRAFRPQVPNAFLVWDQADVEPCTVGPRSLEIPAGGAVEIHTPSVSAAAILSGGKPDGEYGIAVYARANGRTVELQVGGVDLAAP